MKQKAVKAFVLFTFIMAGILLNSCQEDNIKNESENFKLSYISLDHVKKNQKVMKVLSEKKLIQNSNNSKIIYDSVYDYSIDTDKIIYLESENYHSYTFAVEKSGITTTDNLVLISQPDGSYVTRILSYNLTESDKDAIRTGQPMDFTNKTKIYNLSQSNIADDVFGLAYYGEECYMEFSTEAVVTITPCAIDGCLVAPYATYSTSYVIVGQEVCSGGGGGDTGGSNGPGGGSGGNPIATSPNLPEISDSTPCDKIKNATNTSQYMLNFKNINKPETLALPFEYGFAQVNNSYIYGQAVGNQDVNIPDGAKNYTHTHPNRPKVDEDGNNYNGNVKIHAPNDILKLIKNCQRNNVDKTDAFGIVISDEGIFALSILETIDLSLVSPKWQRFIKNYNDESQTILSNTMLEQNAVLLRKEKLQKMLLNELKKLGLENKIGLFEGTIDNSSLVPKINWQRKKLDASGNLTNEDC